MTTLDACMGATGVGVGVLGLCGLVQFRLVWWVTGKRSHRLLEICSTPLLKCRSLSGGEGGGRGRECTGGGGGESAMRSVLQVNFRDTSKNYQKKKKIIILWQLTKARDGLCLSDFSPGEEGGGYLGSIEVGHRGPKMSRGSGSSHQCLLWVLFWHFFPVNYFSSVYKFGRTVRKF